ncbi:MAG: hypothetical protein WEA81_08685 [Dehalococcoidia bacterium]
MVDVNELELDALEAATAADDPEIDDLIERVDPDAFLTDGDYVSDDGDALPDEVQAELEALAASELSDEGVEGGSEGLQQALAEAQREVARQRTLTRQAVTRYREALLAAEPDLPPDLVRGETLEEIDSATESARATVKRIRERVTSVRPRGFPVGAPARSSEREGRGRMSAQEKIAAGLQERMM